MSRTYRLVPVDSEGEMFTLDVEVDEAALIGAYSAFIGQAKDRFNPRKVTRVKLIPDPATFKQDL